MLSVIWSRRRDRKVEVRGTGRRGEDLKVLDVHPFNLSSGISNLLTDSKREFCGNHSSGKASCQFAKASEGKSLQKFREPSGETFSNCCIFRFKNKTDN